MRPQQPGLIIDCDTGRDDALAIWLALGLGKNLAGLIASYGNTIRDNVTENCTRVLGFAGRGDIPLFVGAATPATNHAGIEKIVHPRQKTSGNGMCNLELPVTNTTPVQEKTPGELAEALKNLAAENGPLDYVITGPATNLATILHALDVDPHQVFKRITMMGGKLAPLWDQMPAPDFNIACDPHAVARILKSGLDVRFVTMNTTWPVMLPLADVEALIPTTKIAAFAKDLMIAHCKHFAPEPVFRFHDPSVIAVLDDASYDDVKIDIDLDDTSNEFGRLRITDTGWPARIHNASPDARQNLLSGMLETLGFKAAS